MSGPQDGLSAEYRSFLDRQRNPTPEPAPSVLPSFTFQTEREVKGQSGFEQAKRSMAPSVPPLPSPSGRTLTEAWDETMADGEQSAGPSVEAFSPSPIDYNASNSDDLGQTDAEVEEVGEKGSSSPLVQSGIPLPAKRRMVEMFACFHTLSQVQAAMLAEYGLGLDARTVAAYDCSNRNCRIGKRLRSLYAEVRSHYIASTQDVAIAHQSRRLRLIGQLVEKATNSKDYAAALKGLELAAKEMGGVLEGRSTVKHEGAIAHVHGTVEDMRLELGMRLQGIVDGGTLLPAPTVDAVSGSDHGNTDT